MRSQVRDLSGGQTLEHCTFGCSAARQGGSTEPIRDPQRFTFGAGQRLEAQYAARWLHDVGHGRITDDQHIRKGNPTRRLALLDFGEGSERRRVTQCVAKSEETPANRQRRKRNQGQRAVRNDCEISRIRQPAPKGRWQQNVAQCSRGGFRIASAPTDANAALGTCVDCLQRTCAAAGASTLAPCAHEARE
jgi:hypothetical protein